MKKWIALVWVFVLILCLGACGKKQAANPDSAQADVICGESTGNAMPNQWGVTLETENITKKGLTLLCHHSGGENVFELHTGSYYVIQKLENESWVDVEYLPQEYAVAWTMEAWTIQKESTTTWDVNWEWLYGELPAGEYRIGKEIMNFRGTGDYDKEMIYAGFIIK